VPFQNVSAFGVDQLNAQRMFCCKSPQDASKAIIWSSVGQLVTLLMLMVGSALFVWYVNNPPEGPVAEAMGWREDGTPGKGDNVFPVWIVTVLPPGLSGLILGGVFAAAISSLDSILAALSQTTVSLLHKPDGEHDPSKDAYLLRQSRLWVVVWGVFLTGFTLLMKIAQDRSGVPVLPLAFGMTTYTMGPLLAMFLCALMGRGSFRGLLIGSIASFVFVLFIRTDVWLILDYFGLSFAWLDQLPMYWVEGDTGNQVLKPSVGFFWAWPVTTLVTLACGLLIGSSRKRFA
jgi:Na+/proline symporter